MKSKIEPPKYPSMLHCIKLQAVFSPLSILTIVLIAWLVSPSSTQAQTCPPALQTPSAEQIQQAQRNIRNRGYLWKISKDNRSSYLYGTIHLGRFEWIFPGPNLKAALQAVDVLALELDPLDQQIQTALATLQQKQQPVPLPPKLRQRLDHQITASCALPQTVAHLSPIMQTVIVSVLRGRFQGLEAAYGQEVVLSSLARQTGKPIVSLETAEIQLSALIPNSTHETLSVLDSMLSQLESGKAERYFLRLAEIWNTGNLSDLENFQSWCECAETEIDKRMLKRINDDRNSDMAERINALHTQGKKVLAAVGALHMTGNQSLPRLMKQRGFTVERIH